VPQVNVPLSCWAACGTPYAGPARPSSELEGGAHAPSLTCLPGGWPVEHSPGGEHWDMRRMGRTYAVAFAGGEAGGSWVRSCVADSRTGEAMDARLAYHILTWPSAAK
jgi:hypothetical protein